MPNIEPVRMANGGVPRRLTFELMREMREQIYKHKGLLPDLVRCSLLQRDRYLKLFGERLNMAMVEAAAFDGVPILIDVDGTIPSDQMEWSRSGWGVLGVLADLWTDPPTWCPTCD